MPSSEEYLAKLGFSLNAAEFRQQIISVLGHASEAIDGMSSSAERAQAALEGTGKGGKNAAKGIKDANKEAQEGSAAWKEYRKQLSDANAAYREFRKGEVTGEGGGRDAPRVNSGAGQQLLAINDASNANVITALKDEQREIERTNKLRDKAVADAQAGFDRETAARVKAYSTQAAAAEDLYQREKKARDNAAAEATYNQNQRRYAPAPPSAQGRLVTPGDPQQLKAMGDYYRAQEQISKSTDTMSGKTAALNENLISQRYALYDVATTYAAVGVALLAASGYAVTVGAQFESAFTGVERTLEGGQSAAAVEAIRQELIELSAQIPITFEELSRIATLGNQLGVGADDLTEFTQVVAEFSTVTGMTAEASAQAFGRISNILGLPIANARQLGSAIAAVGVSSASTEQEIVGLTERLGASATRAGFTADQVVGLAGALGSLGVAPERAQGVFETYFNSLNDALSTGGDKLEAFAAITGTTADELQNLVRSGQGYEVFQKFLDGMEGADTVELTSALDMLGLSGLRANEVIGRLTQSQEILGQSFSIAAQGYADGTELSRQFAFIVDDLASQFQMLINNVNALVESLSGGLVPGLAGVLGLANQFVTFLREVAENEVAVNIIQIGGAFTTFVGILFALRAAQFLATASTYALVTAQSTLGASGVRTGILGLVSAMYQLATGGRVAAAGVGAVGPAATGAGRGLSVLGKGLIFVGRATVVIGILQLLVGLLTDTQGTVLGLADVFDFLIDTGINVANTMYDIAQSLVTLATSIPLIGGAFNYLQKGIDFGRKSLSMMTPVVRGVNDGFKGWAKTLPGLNDGLGDVTGATYDAAGAFGEGTGGAGNFGDALDDMGGSAGGAAAEIRTLVDYANDLQSINDRSFEIRFGGEMAYDTISAGWNTIRNSIEDTNESIREYQATMMSLTADKAIREYWLSVAENYGDALRAGELRAELADIDNKLATTARDLSDAQAKNSGILTGNTDAAIENRASLTGLVQNYQSYITALASSGLSQEELTAATARAKAEFISQATALGYPIEQVLRYAQAFNDTAIAIDRVPRNITVAANVNPALQALNELEARARQVGSGNYGGVNIPVNGYVSPGAKDALFTQWATTTQQQYGRALAQNAAGWAEVRRLWESGAYGQFKEGGWTGGIGRNDVAGVVHGQEYVLNATGAQMFPRQMLDMANQGQSPFASRSSGSGKISFPSSMMVELSPIDRELVASGATVTVVLDPGKVGESASSSYADDSRRGGS